MRATLIGVTLRLDFKGTNNYGLDANRTLRWSFIFPFLAISQAELTRDLPGNAEFNRIFH